MNARAATRRSLVLTLLGLLAWPPAAAGQETSSPGLDDLAFMAGCWRGAFGEDGVIEEFYTGPAGGLTLGLTRFLRDGRAVQHEFARIEADSGGVALHPFPGGRPSPARFRLTSADARTAVFEAPEHDFPKRIIYRGHPDGRLTARIDGGVGSEDAREWTMDAVACR